MLKSYAMSLSLGNLPLATSKIVNKLSHYYSLYRIHQLLITRSFFILLVNIDSWEEASASLMFTF